MIQIVKIKINGMHCVSCAMNIDGELEETEGILESNTNYAKQETEVKFDSEKLAVDVIVKKVQVLGYRTQEI